MHRKIAITMIALALGGGFVLTSPPASAQRGQQQEHAQGQSRGGGQAVAPRGGGRNAVSARGGAGALTSHATRTVTSRTIRTVSPSATRTLTRRATRIVTPKVVAPKVTAKGASPSSANASVVTAARLRGMPERGAGRATIDGHNYSVWRSRYRVRYGSGWRTFIALSTLSAIAIGSRSYYPYAYISAPQPYCEGLTADGCQLMWQEVETVEGDVINQCVAYCPWR